MKTCNVCKIEKPNSEFAPRFNRPGGFMYTCRVCKNLACQKWVSANPAKKIYWASRANSRRSVTASIADWMTLEEFILWYAQQLKVCEICGSLDKLRVDHDHATGRPRGILCNDCNLVEGKIGTVCKAESLLKYVRKHAPTDLD